MSSCLQQQGEGRQPAGLRLLCVKQEGRGVVVCDCKERATESRPSGQAQTTVRAAGGVARMWSESAARRAHMAHIKERAANSQPARLRELCAKLEGLLRREISHGHGGHQNQMRGCPYLS